MKGKISLFISLCVMIAIVFTSDLAAELKVYDGFNGDQIDQTLWNHGDSNSIFFTQLDGLLSANAPPGAYYSGWISSRIAFPGDFELILDWRDYPVFFLDKDKSCILNVQQNN